MAPVLPVFLAFLLSFPAAAAIVAGPEVPLTPFTTTETPQELPDLAFAGDLGLAVWRESGIGAALVDANGAVTPLGLLTEHDFPGAPRVASDGNGWLAVWVQSEVAYGRHVARDGTFGPPFAIASEVLGDGLAIAWDGSAYVCVFLRGINVRFGVDATVTAARIHADGRIEETVLSDSGQHGVPVIAAGSNGVLVIWVKRWLTDHFRGVLLSPTGTVTPLVVDHYNRATVGPGVAWNGSTFVVAAPYERGIEWVRVNDNGVVTFTPATSALLLRPLRLVHLTAIGERFLLLADGQAAILDPRGFVSEPGVPLVPDRDARAAGPWVIYAKALDAERPAVTRVFVRRIDVAANPPRRHAVRR